MYSFLGIAGPVEALATEPFFLVVEDDEVIRRGIGRAANGGLAVRFAPTGQEALDALRGPLPRFVLLDFGLPDMDGLQVLRRLRADPRCGSLPVIIFSSLRDDARRQQTLAAGADAWVAKPDHPEELRQAVQGLCARWGNPSA
jgi:twitching motility two-component system response regulator PilH